MGAGVSSIITQTLDLRGQGIDYRLLQQHFQVVGDFSLNRVTKLYLCNNKLSSLPPQISLCKSLQELYCKNNWLKWLPEEITTLTQLQLARFGGNALLEISPLVALHPTKKGSKVSMRSGNVEPEDDEEAEAISPLSNLVTLRIGHNRLRNLPSGLDTLKLSTLICNNNHLTVLPPELFLLTSLQTLVLSHNFLCVLPDTISEAEKLQVLVLSHNRLETLPASIGSRRALTKLVELHLGKNLLRQLPAHMGLIPHVKHIDLSNNNLTLQEIKISGLLHSKSNRYLALTPGNVSLDEVADVTDPSKLREILTPRRGGGSNSNSQRSGRSSRRSARSSGRSGRHSERGSRRLDNRGRSTSRSPGRSDGDSSSLSNQERRSASSSPGRSRGRRKESVSKGRLSPGSGEERPAGRTRDQSPSGRSKQINTNANDRGNAGNISPSGAGNHVSPTNHSLREADKRDAPTLPSASALPPPAGFRSRKVEEFRPAPLA